jgi:hypothetical protein
MSHINPKRLSLAPPQPSSSGLLSLCHRPSKWISLTPSQQKCITDTSQLQRGERAASTMVIPSYYHQSIIVKQQRRTSSYLEISGSIPENNGDFQEDKKDAFLMLQRFVKDPCSFSTRIRAFTILKRYVSWGVCKRQSCQNRVGSEYSFAILKGCAGSVGLPN